MHLYACTRVYVTVQAGVSRMPARTLDMLALPSCRPKDEKNRQVEPRTFANFQLPLKPPYVWGTVCSQYDWPDKAPMAGFKYYKNAWRHENETW
jgi:hypothetical protein